MNDINDTNDTSKGNDTSDANDSGDEHDRADWDNAHDVYAPPRAEIKGNSFPDASWSRVLAVLNIIYGIFGLYCFMGVPLFMASSKLLDAANAADRFKRSGEVRDAEAALQSYAASAKLTAINWLIILGIILLILIGYGIVIALVALKAFKS